MYNRVVRKKSMIKIIPNKIILDKELDYKEMYFIMTNQKLIKTNFGTSINFLMNRRIGK